MAAVSETKARKCGICKQTGHDRRKCPKKLQASEDQMWQLVHVEDTAAAIADSAPPELSLRASVAKKKPDVWEYRCERDAYTLQTAARVEKEHPQVDHVWEIQCLDLVLARAAKQATVAPRQCELTQLREVANDLANLNVTTRAVNQKKKGPFMAWCKRQNEESKLRILSLAQLARTAFATEKEQRTWALITGTLASSFDRMVDSLQADLQPTTTPVVAAFVEQVSVAFDSFGLDA